jgi:transcriptional regulator with XRE-family HTH domain
MLNPAVADYIKDSGQIDPAALAQSLDISLADLAAMIGVSRNTLAAKPLGSKASEALRPLIKILALATELAGSERRAIIWFKFNPIISLGTKTAQEHVADGHADWVLAHIEDLLNGVYA